MSVTSVDDVRALVATGLSDANLQALIDRIEADITDAIGAPYVDASTPITETHSGHRGKNLYLKRKIGSVSSITEYATLDDLTGSALTEHVDFRVWSGEGRVERIGGGWNAVATVSYVPVDDRSKWKAAVIDAVRLVIARMPMASESVAGELSYTAPHWEAEKRNIMRRLMLAAF